MTRDGNYCKMNNQITTTSLMTSSILILKSIIGTRRRLVKEYENELMEDERQLQSHVAN